MIRPAKLTDAPAIKSLHDRYELDLNRVNDSAYAEAAGARGFMVNAGDVNVSSRIKSATLLLVDMDRDTLVGYIELNLERYFPEDAENIVWDDPKVKWEYFHGAHTVTLHNIATSQAGSGVAHKLLERAIEELRTLGYQHVFSIISTGPITNQRSLDWHRHNGFRQVCYSQPITIFGLENYESVLMHREI